MAGDIVDLINSALAFPLATSFLGIQEMTRALKQGLRGCRSTRPEAALYAATSLIEDELSNAVSAVFDAGNDIQRMLIDLLYDTASGEVLKPAGLDGAINAVSHQSYASLRAIATPQLAWLEFQNKLEVYKLVQNVQALSIPAGPDFPLRQLVEDAYESPVYTRLWIVEGLGNRCGLNALKSPPVRGLLTEGIAKQLPRKSLLMLHAGLGLAFATVGLDGANPYGCPAALQEKVDYFVELCTENSGSEYVGAAYESMGLVTRTFYPEAVRSVDRCLRARYPDLVAYFWHGVGRALFFYPTFFLPGTLSPWQAAVQEAPDDFAYGNALAGLAWAFTLVNIRQPEILADYLSAPEWAVPPRQPFANGVISSMIMARNVEPDESYTEELCRYQPDAAAPQFAENWEALIRPSCANLLRFSQTLAEHHRLDQVFQYQDLARLVAILEGRGTTR